MQVSIRAPRAGGDSSPGCSDRRLSRFNPRPPRGGRLMVHLQITRADISPAAIVSIRAPRAGGDRGYRLDVMLSLGFNPRPPRGGRFQAVRIVAAQILFNPRPARGAILRTFRIVYARKVSIRAPRAGGDAA